jgi:hypothetical protein
LANAFMCYNADVQVKTGATALARKKRPLTSFRLNSTSAYHFHSCVLSNFRI